MASQGRGQSGKTCPKALVSSKYPPWLCVRPGPRSAPLPCLGEEALAVDHFFGRAVQQAQPRSGVLHLHGGGEV